LQFIGALLLIAGLFYFRRAYTSVTFCLTAAFIGALYFFRDFFRDFSATFFLIAYAIALIPFLVVNGLLTALPVVEYNDAENLGIRIYTIPFEDVFYGMLLMMMIIALYERRRHRSLSSAP
jgi:lycopene cyclase domain-containing protein